MAKTREIVIICLFAAGLLVGCDPGGLRRVQLRLPQTQNAGGSTATNQQDVQETLQILDGVLGPLGFRAVPESPTNNYIRVYILRQSPVMVEGRSYSRDVPIRVSQTPKGIEVAFGEFGLLGCTPEPAVRAFKATRTAFVKRYGSRNIKTRTFGLSKAPDEVERRGWAELDTNSLPPRLLPFRTFLAVGAAGSWGARHGFLFTGLRVAWALAPSRAEPPLDLALAVVIVMEVILGGCFLGWLIWGTI